ncbi:hypothetical protein BJX96DRAFT_128533 [Aspergillus floccosus]
MCESPCMVESPALVLAWNSIRVWLIPRWTIRRPRCDFLCLWIYLDPALGQFCATIRGTAYAITLTSSDLFSWFMVHIDFIISKRTIS